MSHQAGLPYVEGEFTLEESLVVATDGRRARAARSRSGSRERSTATTCARTAGSSARSSAAPIRSTAVPARSGARRSRDRSAPTSGSGSRRSSSPGSPSSFRPKVDLREALEAFGDDALLARCSPIRAATSTTTTCGTPAGCTRPSCRRRTGSGARAVSRGSTRRASARSTAGRTLTPRPSRRRRSSARAARTRC